jgi:MFS family permease
MNPNRPACTREAAMPFIMVTMLIDMLAIGLIIPVLPAMVGSFTGSQSDQAYWYGVVTFTFGLANFISSPILGSLSDQHGRRPILLLGFLGLCISFYGTAMATAMGMLIAVRILSGAMQANISICNAYVADFTPPEQRAKRFGMLGAMQGVGFIVGPVMGHGQPLVGAESPGPPAWCGLAGGRGGMQCAGAIHPLHQVGALHHLRIRLGPAGKRLVTRCRGGGLAPAQRRPAHQRAVLFLCSVAAGVTAAGSLAFQKTPAQKRGLNPN